jgi:hypothetical protein
MSYAARSVLIHADGTIQVREKGKGNIWRLGGKTFRLADQAWNDGERGPYVYTEIPDARNADADAKVIPFPFKTKWKEEAGDEGVIEQRQVFTYAN